MNPGNTLPWGDEWFFEPRPVPGLPDVPLEKLQQLPAPLNLPNVFSFAVLAYQDSCVRHPSKHRNVVASIFHIAGIPTRVIAEFFYLSPTRIEAIVKRTIQDLRLDIEWRRDESMMSLLWLAKNAAYSVGDRRLVNAAVELLRSRGLALPDCGRGSNADPS